MYSWSVSVVLSHTHLTVVCLSVYGVRGFEFVVEVGLTRLSPKLADTVRALHSLPGMDLIKCRVSITFRSSLAASPDKLAGPWFTKVSLSLSP